MSFDKRNTPGGIYATCFDKFSKHHDSLSQLDFPPDFRGQTSEWPPDRFATQFFRPNDPDHELVVVLFGEVLDGCDGTAVGARGSSALKHDRVSLL